VVEDEQEDAVEDEEVVQEEDLSSDEEADPAGPVKWARQLKTKTNKKHRRRVFAEKTRTRGGRYCKTRNRTEFIVDR
jgi:hypothetical protein